MQSMIGAGEDEVTGGVVNGTVTRVSIRVRAERGSTNHCMW